MDPQTRELWTRLQQFSFDSHPAAFTFRDRLARDNGWDRPFADRVLEEYRRFVLLAARAGHPVTPSDEVDQAWHLHLTYTRSYWEDLCGGVLQAPLHHGPTRGGAGERAKFHDWYARTIDSYRRMFGVDPPLDIWPPAAVRFGRAPHFRRIDTSRVWLVPRPQWRPLLRHPATGGLLLAFGVTAGCAATGVPATLFVGLAAVLVFFAVRAHARSRQRRGGRPEDGSSGDSGVPFWTWGSGGGEADGGGHGHHGDSGSGDSSSDGGGDGGSSGCGSSGCGSGGCGGGCGS